MFNALVLDKTPEFTAAVRAVDDDFLPPVEADRSVTIDIDYSTLNYKDALAITNTSPVVRSWPMVAGIDGVGTVTHSAHPRWHVGDRVVHNGAGVGETHKGCLAQRARLNGDWLVALPEAFTMRQAMAIGTAGYTAMLCVMALERHGALAGGGEVLVTGASGGVGSVAVALLSRLGHTVVAATGKPEQAEFLMSLGANRVIDRAELTGTGKPLQKERWRAVVDVAGSHTLVNACAQTYYGGAVAACGLAQGFDLTGTVMPFILRGVALLGIDSVMAPLEQRQLAWQRLATDLDTALLDKLTTEIALADAIDMARRLRSGQVTGRVVVRTRP